MNIHQVSVNYLHEQDRILVRINSHDAQEIRLWLTRRLCIGWVPALRATLRNMAAMLVETADNTGTADTVNKADMADKTSSSADQPLQEISSTRIEELQQLHSLQNTDFKTPFKSEVQTWPLGADPLLVTTIRMTAKSKNKLEMAFEESLLTRQAQVRGFQVSLEPQLLTGFLHLLEKALDSAHWGQDDAASVLGNPLTMVVEGDDHGLQQRPKYLH